MTVPYEESGRRAQKQRTLQALITATRRLMATGVTPTVEEAAAAAGISRTTAYRYYPNQHALVMGAHPEVQQSSLLPDDAPDDPVERFELVLTTHLRTLIEWEPQLRATLRRSLEPTTDAAELPLRQGRVIGWLEDALSPLGAGRPELDVHRIAVAIRAAAGIESLVWLTDVAGLPREEALDVLRSNARAILAAALKEPTAPPTPSKATDPSPRRPGMGS